MIRHRIIQFLAMATMALVGCQTPDAPVVYMPKLAFSPSWNSHFFHEGWYREYLEAMQEPSLLPRAARNAEILGEYLPNIGGEWDPPSVPLVCRFLFIGGYGNGAVFRVEITADRAIGWLITKRTRGTEWKADPGELVSDHKTALSAGQISTVIALLKGMLTLTMPALGRYAGCDGTRWVLEIVEGDEYQVVSRWTPRMPITPEMLPEAEKKDIDRENHFNRQMVELGDYLFKASPLSSQEDFSFY